MTTKIEKKRENDEQHQVLVQACKRRNLRVVSDSDDEAEEKGGKGLSKAPVGASVKGEGEASGEAELLELEALETNGEDSEIDAMLENSLPVDEFVGDEAFIRGPDDFDEDISDEAVANSLIIASPMVPDTSGVFAGVLQNIIVYLKDYAIKNNVMHMVDTEKAITYGFTTEKTSSSRKLVKAESVRIARLDDHFI
ncbi:hypothetical protein ASPZODRAFT_15732 [Penicilliopsis zonata CBS 506.65]|uniref:Uncharacterized protein n=1 Tax=Penicilliopsis zonata CBS 506.65 TaxID=1073090 RepID=A0A1L9SIM0_9EURO|nr:hypothetical protein ASPZODRAFT_15732 [Penicilliopsis zonata CBS 506.65]OJJ47048.1 hypothetical protein ASPZODRAFT_15732 [Penicilliopsis zonata CBS 506.65]